MKETQDKDTDVLKRLEAIHSTLQDALILQAKVAGLSKSSTRAIVGVADARVSRIWKAAAEKE